MNTLVVRFGIAALAAIAAVLARVWLDSELSGTLPFITAFAAITISAWLGGMLPGLVCAAVTYVGITLFVNQAHGMSPFESRQGLVSFVLYVVSSLLIAGAGGAARLYMRRLAAANLMLREKQDWLTWQVEQLNRNQQEREQLLERERTAHAQAQEAHGRMLAILESIGDAFYALDERWCYTYINARAERYYGLPKNSIIGRNVWEVFPQALNSELPHHFQRVLDSGLPDHFQFISPVSHRWLDLHIYPADKGLAVFFEDIHEARLTEAALQESRMRFEAFMQNSPARAWIKDEQLRYVFVNDAFGHAAGTDMLGKTDLDLFDAETAEAIRRRDRLVIESGTPRQMVETVEEQGVRRHVLCVRFVIEGVGGQRYLAGKGVDISEQIWAQNALREADRRKDEFLATLAHELRNPLSPVRSAAAFVRAKTPEDAQLRQAVELIDRQVSRMARLLDDLLDVSRMTFNKLELRREHVAVADLMQRAVETIRPLLSAVEHEVDIRLPESPVFVYGDPARLEQVLSNLLNNAVKYTEPGGRVTLETSVDGEWVSIAVRDDGIGIEPAKLPRLFEMFSQLGDARGDSKGGLGIGLALVRALVQMHGGTVKAHSEGIGQGSVFTVRLPLTRSESHEASASAQPPAAPDRDRGRKRRVMVVDDNTDAVHGLVMLLELAGHEVRAAYDGNQALDIATSFQPDAVLLDIGLPGLSGCDVAKWIRRQCWGGEVLLIAVTGWGQPEDQRRTAAAGFDHHLTKPVSPETVERLLAIEGHCAG